MERIVSQRIVLSRGRKIAVIVIRVFIILAALVGFAFYAIPNTGNYNLLEFALAAAALAGFTVVAVLCVPSVLETLLNGEDTVLPDRKGKTERRRTFLIICAAALGLHLLTYFLGIAVYSLIKNSGRIEFSSYILRNAWMKTNTDAHHYVNIAENGYLAEGNDRLLIVFFPMLPYLIRAFNFIFGDSYVSATVINAIAVPLTAGMTYLTLIPVLGSRQAKLSAFITMLLPGAIFMNSPMTEPLFMLFSVTGFYFLQRKRYVLAGVFTALAGFTRSLGVLLAVPIALVGIGNVICLIRQKKPFAGTLAKLAAGLLISVVGTLAYLYINYRVHGDPLKFLEFQWENWHQKACPFFDTPRYLLYQAKASFEKGADAWFSLWLPEYLFIYGTLVLMALRQKKLPASFNVYMLCYYAVSVGCTWLLSAVRYICAALPFTAAVGSCLKTRTKAVIAFIIICLLYCAYLVFYMLRYGTY